MDFVSELSILQQTWVRNHFDACAQWPDKRFKGLKISDEYTAGLTGTKDDEASCTGAGAVSEARHRTTTHGHQVLWSLSQMSGVWALIMHCIYLFIFLCLCLWVNIRS